MKKKKGLLGALAVGAIVPLSFGLVACGGTSCECPEFEECDHVCEVTQDDLDNINQCECTGDDLTTGDVWTLITEGPYIIAAQTLVNTVNAIPNTVVNAEPGDGQTVISAAQINQVIEAYLAVDSLSTVSQGMLTNRARLTALSNFAVVRSQITAITAVETAIEAVPAEVTAATVFRVISARAAFDGLTAERQGQVRNAADLPAAPTSALNGALGFRANDGEDIVAVTNSSFNLVAGTASLEVEEGTTHVLINVNALTGANIEFTGDYAARFGLFVAGTATAPTLAMPSLVEECDDWADADVRTLSFAIPADAEDGDVLSVYLIVEHGAEEAARVTSVVRISIEIVA